MIICWLITSAKKHEIDKKFKCEQNELFDSPNKLFDSAKLLRRWFTFLRLRVDGDTEPSREPETSASKSAVLGGLLFSMVKPEAC